MKDSAKKIYMQQRKRKNLFDELNKKRIIFSDVLFSNCSNRSVAFAWVF